MTAENKNNERNYLDNKETGTFFGIVAAMGTMIGVWAMVTLFSGLSSVDWQISEMCRQFLVATGSLLEHETMVDFYSHISGVEYLIAVAFFIGFPFLLKSLNQEEATVSNR